MSTQEAVITRLGERGIVTQVSGGISVEGLLEGDDSFVYEVLGKAQAEGHQCQVPGPDPE